MLSATAYLLLGNDIVSTLVLAHMISSMSKMVHGLVYSDVEPRDRQNFLSCQKICKPEVIQLLQTTVNDVPGAKGMVIYLTLIRSVMIAYDERNIQILDRLYHGWLSVFIRRLCFACLDSQSKDKLKKFFDYFSKLCNKVSSECLNKFQVLNSEKNDEKQHQKEDQRRNEKSEPKQHFIITQPCYLSIEINANSWN